MNNALDQEALEEGDVIARFMGYIHKYKAHEDFSDIGGLYTDVTYYSKTPLQFEFTHEDGRGERIKLPEYKDREILIVYEDGCAIDGQYDLKLKYSESWDWLIPVCKKLDGLSENSVSLKMAGEYIKLCDEMDHLVSLYEIKLLYNHVVRFIKWYNDFCAIA